MWGQQGQKITWNANNTPDSQKQAGGWYDNPATGYNTQWLGAGQPSNQSSSMTGQSSSNTSNDYTSIAQQQLKLSQEANKPVLESLQKSQSTLSDRYKAVLDSITNREGTAISSAQTAATNEWSARGIPVESGAFTQFLGNRVNPVQTQYQDLKTNTMASEQSDLADIAYKIASLQSEGNQSALQQALSLYQYQNPQKTPTNPADDALKQAQAKYYLAQANNKTNTLNNDWE